VSTHREPAVRNTLILILVLNALVAAVKIVVGLRTNALSVLGASLESALDVLNNIVGIALVRVASQEPDEDHPYGHQKFETLGALAIVGFLSISCFELLREGVRHLLISEHPDFPSIADLSLIAATMLVNVAVVWYERRRARQLQSDFLLADASHTRSDIYVTAAAFASLVLARRGYGWVDALLAIGVALLIAWNGYQIVRHTVPVLVDERGVDASILRRVVGGIPNVVDVRKVRSRAIASDVRFAEVTIGVNGETTVAEAHHIADIVEEKIAKELGVAEVLVHVEPA
jgi:cation diffusion facilitator family transporter